MDGMTNEEIEFTVRLTDAGFEPEDIYERLGEEVPLELITMVVNHYNDSLMGGGDMEAYY